MFKTSVMAAIAIVALGANSALAGNATVAIAGGNLQVSATINSSCSAAQGTPVAFGAIQSLASAVNTTGTISVTCDTGTPYAVGLGLGQNPSGQQRQMSAFIGTGFSYLPYQLYVDAAYTTAFTDITTGASGSPLGSSVASTPGSTGTGLAQTLTVYGQIAAGTKPPPGNYSDSVVITVGY